MAKENTHAGAVFHIFTFSRSLGESKTNTKAAQHAIKAIRDSKELAVSVKHRAPSTIRNQTTTMVALIVPYGQKQGPQSMCNIGTKAGTRNTRQISLDISTVCG